MPDAARLAAYDVLHAVRTEDAYANLALAQALRDRRLSGRDAGFATELAAGTLRGLGTYDPVIDACLDRGRVKPRLRDVLRLGTHQLLAMRVPSHAAVSATVDLARSRTGPASAGLVNAVLRKVGEHDLAGWIDRVAPDPAADRTGHLAVAHSHPRWVVIGLEAALGDRAAELEELLAADNTAPEVVLVARPGRSEAQRAARRADPALAVRRAARGGRPRRGAGRCRGPCGRPGRGVAAGRGRRGGCRARGSGRALARPVCRSRRQGSAAGGAGRGTRRPAGRQRAPAPPHRARETRARRRRWRRRDHDVRRPATAVGAGVLRPGAGRRAVLGTRGAATPARGALAEAAWGPRRAGAAPA